MICQFYARMASLLLLTGSNHVIELVYSCIVLRVNVGVARRGDLLCYAEFYLVALSCILLLDRHVLF